jgi:hypothetical protein
MATTKLNHSRKMDYGAHSIGLNEYAKAHHSPTEKQKKFYKSLIIDCNKANIDTNDFKTDGTRGSYADAIENMLKALGREGNGKEFARCFVNTSDEFNQGRRVYEHILPVDENGDVLNEVYPKPVARGHWVGGRYVRSEV